MTRGLVVALALALVAGQALAESPETFGSAKREAMRIFDDHRETFYCGCLFSRTKRVAPATCGFEPESESTRSYRIEWEHIVPASKLGEGRACWDHPERFAQCRGKSGRACCGRIDRSYRLAESDLLNLRPAVGELNAARSNHPFGIVPGEPRRWGACDFELEDGIVEPRPSIRGDIARAYLWMSFRHGVRLSDAEWWRFMDWSLADPPDEWEIEHRRRVLDDG